MPTPPRYVTASEAAAMLGVSTATLYAYVSRGLLRSEAGEGSSRARRYLVEDIAALQARRSTGASRRRRRRVHWGMGCRCWIRRLR